MVLTNRCFGLLHEHYGSEMTEAPVWFRANAQKKSREREMFSRHADLAPKVPGRINTPTPVQNTPEHSDVALDLLRQTPNEVTNPN